MLDNANDQAYDYLAPGAMADLAHLGSRVMVPLRNRNLRGTIVEVREGGVAALDDKVRRALKPITRVIDERPSLPPDLLKLASWMADYYIASMASVMQTMLPSNIRDEKTKEKTRLTAVMKKPWKADSDEGLALRKRAPKQVAVLTKLAKAPGHKIALADLASDLGNDVRTSVRSLESKGWLEVVTEQVERDPFANADIVGDSALELTGDQQTAVTAIHTAIDADAPKPILLLGVTGSGKTEVYLQSIQHAIDQGKGAIVLVPEIALTPQTVERFKSRFSQQAGGVAVLHSHLSDGERFDEWQRIRSGRARIVVGARSAVFAPVPDLGIIVVDEEHENSYKQDNPPRYQARDVAVVRAKICGCAVVLGSATPSLESWENVRKGKYEGLRMMTRIDDRQLPLIRVVDMKIEATKRKDVTILSEPLRQAMEKRLERGEQTILFLNRRGFSPSLQCLACGATCECKHCSIALTFHKSADRLICHMCGYEQVAPTRCPECREPGIKFNGFGTQRVEEVISKVFPKASVERIDADAMRRKERLVEALNRFKTGKTQIVIGTQMIAKGLHFPNVTLVGILNADIGLHIPDFRAGERVFQLLTQVAGRAGRGDLSGEVIVQTFSPHSPSIQFARQHDFDGYSSQELEFRQAFGYPPYARMVGIMTRSTKENMAEFTLQNLIATLKPKLPQNVMIGEPLPAAIARVKGQFRYHVFLRATNPNHILKPLRETLASFTVPDDVYLGVDVDCYQVT
ncbi:primosomal protein N' [Sulfuriroseicoccus oceanibius]|uniref:Replication restart protein PriA n=2 Tax=Sulfuriroseicoccus oceanibius TaxID=2707525 RepID=A0A6B3LB83_9BACT|nr:primosomal protein N' [Sulfuriroseicoccus oceanibius]